MNKDLQRDINLALLRCVIDSHKSAVAFARLAALDKDGSENAMANFEATTAKMEETVNRCLDLIEKADQ